MTRPVKPVHTLTDWALASALYQGRCYTGANRDRLPALKAEARRRAAYTGMTLSQRCNLFHASGVRQWPPLHPEAALAQKDRADGE